MVDFTRLGSRRVLLRHTNPLEIFRALRMVDGAVGDLWFGQGDALREWALSREQCDIAIELNTGSGKTLVGLLIAQALCNELRSPVVYCCASKQLVLQTTEKATGYGIRAASYLESRFDSEVGYLQGEIPCVTTYHAVFNSKSRFAQHGVAALILDDAHTAASIFRDQYTLRLTRTENEDLYRGLTELFSDYFKRTDQDVAFRETVESEDPARRWFVPPFEVQRVEEQVKALLLGAKLGATKLDFAWRLLKDKLDLCAVVVTASFVSFTPPILPISESPFLGPGIRRVYLSATLGANDVFLRSFGREPSVRIAPPTKAGDCERQILIPGLARGTEGGAAEAVADLVANLKAMILVPTRREQVDWTARLGVPTPVSAEDAVGSFKAAEGPEKLVLAARYDGVDLPGDECRVLVLAGLPAGIGPLERYLWQDLQTANALQGLIACRIVQSLGRIGRGFKDHGVILIVGRDLVEWLARPANQQVLPPFLRAQVRLGIRISEDMTAEEAAPLIRSCLQQEPSWVDFYQKELDAELDGLAKTEDPGVLAVEVAKAEVEFMEYFWHRRYQEAAEVLSEHSQTIADLSAGLAGWLRLWEGYCWQLAGFTPRAEGCYRRARALHSGIPLHAPVATGSTGTYSEQARRIAEALEGLSKRQFLETFDHDLTHLADSATPSQQEEAARFLGVYLGLEATRPDKEFGTGPDVLWSLGARAAIALELKTKKIPSSTYSKGDIMQVKDHLDWVRAHRPVELIVPVIVGPDLQCDGKATPVAGIRVASLAELIALRDQLRSVISGALESAPPGKVAWLLDNGLTANRLTTESLLTEHFRGALRAG